METEHRSPCRATPGRALAGGRSSGLSAFFETASRSARLAGAIPELATSSSSAARSAADRSRAFGLAERAVMKPKPRRRPSSSLRCSAPDRAGRCSTASRFPCARRPHSVFVQNLVDPRVRCTGTVQERYRHLHNRQRRCQYLVVPHRRGERVKSTEGIANARHGTAPGACPMRGAKPPERARPAQAPFAERRWPQAVWPQAFAPSVLA